MPPTWCHLFMMGIFSILHCFFRAFIYALFIHIRAIIFIFQLGSGRSFFFIGFRNHPYYIYNITLLVRLFLPSFTTQPSKEKCFLY
uniref:Uncharacterized protein n=1 Tax=Picea glauca TaxID=3330 RepID=A0A101LVY9_PICGL|nr:hypothetical protein ABT39_MTgene1843 [Picea glauca]